MATEYKLTEKNLNNITVRRKQIISRFSASSLKYVRVLKQDILHKFRSANKLLNFKNNNLDYFKKPIRVRYPRMVYRYPKWFQFKLVFRPNLSKNNFVYSVYKKSRKTRNFISTTLNKSFNTAPFLTLSKFNKHSIKHFLLLQSKDYSYSLRIHNFKNAKWRMFSIIESLNTLAGFSADFKRRDLEFFTGLSIYNKLGFFKWFFINTLQSNIYRNQRFTSIALNSSSYKMSFDQVSRCFFLIQKVIIFEKCRKLQTFNVIKRLLKKQISVSLKYCTYKILLKKIKKIKKNNLEITYILSFLDKLKMIYLRLLQIRHTMGKVNEINAEFTNSLFSGFYFNRFFKFLETNRFLLIKHLTPVQFKNLCVLMKMKRLWIVSGLTSASLRFQEAVYRKIWYKHILRLFKQLSLKIFFERRRLNRKMNLLVNFKKYKQYKNK